MKVGVSRNAWVFACSLALLGCSGRGPQQSSAVSPYDRLRRPDEEAVSAERVTHALGLTAPHVLADEIVYWCTSASAPDDVVDWCWETLTRMSVDRSNPAWSAIMECRDARLLRPAADDSDLGVQVGNATPVEALWLIRKARADGRFTENVRRSVAHWARYLPNGRVPARDNPQLELFIFKAPYHKGIAGAMEALLVSELK